jgi:hypothetical protein
MFSFVMFGDFSEILMQTPGKVTAKAAQVFLNQVAHAFDARRNPVNLLQLFKRIDDFYIQKSGR